jgi:hypothetical protein
MMALIGFESVAGNERWRPDVKEAAMKIYLTWTVMVAALVAVALAGFAGAVGSRHQPGLSDAAAYAEPQRPA